MHIEVKRKILNPDSTIGGMFIDGNFFAHTLEDTWRVLEKQEDKVWGKTAIPAGTYKVKLTYSNRFKKILPELLDVPYFKAIRIHGGNTAADTEGCILVGSMSDGNRIWNCKQKVTDIVAMITKAAKAKEDITITVSDQFTSGTV